MHNQILVVEDDRIVASDIQQQLTRLGYNVISTPRSGTEALESIRNSLPDLVLMDVRLKGRMDGIETARCIQEIGQVPIVYLTAYADVETIRRASATEPYGYLIKPYDELQLRTVIEMALHKHAAERRLRESERRFSATLASIGDAVISTDPNGQIEFINSAAESITGWMSKEAVGRHLSEVFKLDEAHGADLPKAGVCHESRSVRAVLSRRDGNSCEIEHLQSPILDDRKRTIGTVVVFRDVSWRLEVEEMLRRTRDDLARVARLTTMGELVGSIAHEINQPLMALMTNGETCLHYLEQASLEEQREVSLRLLNEAKKAALRTVNNGQRAAQILKSVHALSRRSPPALERVDLNEALLEVLALIQGEMKRQDVVLRVKLESVAGEVLGDRVQLQQVMMNLVVNSIEAMEHVTNRPRLMQVETKLHNDSEMVVTVSDTGEGVPEQNIEQIFEPLFTTKSNGLGLGLAISRSILDAHSGRLSVLKGDPHGSIFQFALPLRRGENRT